MSATARNSSTGSRSVLQRPARHRGRRRRCAPAHALAAADNAAGALTVKVLRARDRRHRDRHRARARPRRACRSARRASPSRPASARPRPTFDLPVEIRNDIARLEIAGERSAGAVQLLDKRWRRRTVGVVSGATADTAQPLLASTYYLVARAQPVRRRAARRSAARRPRRCARFLEQNLPMLILADVGNVAGEARERLTRWVEDGGVLVRFAGPRLAGGRRRSRAGEAAPRRPHARRQPDLGAAAAARGVLAREPVRRHAGAERRDGDAPGAGRARRRPRRPHLGDARRRHAARHRGAARQGHDRAVPRHRRHALVGPAAVRRVRRDAQAHRRARRLAPRPKTTADAQARARSRAADPRARRLRRLRPAARDRAAGAGGLHRARHRRSSARLLRPAGRAARREHARARRPPGADRLSRRSTRGIEAYRLGEPQDLRGPVFLGGAGAARARRAGGVLARRRPVPADAAPPRRGRRDRVAGARIALADRSRQRDALRAQPPHAARSASARPGARTTSP